MREAGDRHQPLGDARVAERLEVMPRGRVAGEMRSEGEQHRHERGDAEEDGEAPAAGSPGDDEPGERDRAASPSR